MTEARTVKAIIRDASLVTGVAEAVLTGEDRTPQAAMIRFAVAWAAREAHGYGAGRVGKAIGRRDPSTIRHAIQRAETLRRSDMWFAGLSEQLLSLAMARQQAALCQENIQ